MEQGRAEFPEWRMDGAMAKLSCAASRVVYFGPSVRLMMVRALWALQR